MNSFEKLVVILATALLVCIMFLTARIASVEAEMRLEVDSLKTKIELLKKDNEINFYEIKNVRAVALSAWDGAFTKNTIDER